MFGALRSGTTLLRLMLKHHSNIHSPGEADCLFDHLRADAAAPQGWALDPKALVDDWTFEMIDVTLPEGPVGGDLIHEVSDLIHDQAPGQIATVSVHRNAPAIASLFPNAKFIHLLRDPRDSARSAVGMGWDGNSYHGVRHWMGTEDSWDLASIPEAQVLTIRFEDLIQDLEGGLTRICTFLGLAFEPGMLDYHETTGYGPPDPSISQKWREQASPREVARIEGRLGPMLEARGYHPVGAPVSPGVIETFWLKADHVLNRWKYNARRYGPGLFFTHHLARALHIKPWADRLAARQLDIKIQGLK